MYKVALKVIADADRAKAPDFSIPISGAQHHDAAAQHYEQAAIHHRMAARENLSGHHQKSGHQAHLAYGHHLHAEQHAIDAAKAHARNHTG